MPHNPWFYGMTNRELWELMTIVMVAQVAIYMVIAMGLTLRDSRNPGRMLEQQAVWGILGMAAGALLDAMLFPGAGMPVLTPLVLSAFFAMLGGLLALTPAERSRE